MTIYIVIDRPNFPRIEETILEEWRSNKVFETSLKRSIGKPLFAFYDGPPFATGLPHYGHILAGTIKDVVCRYAYQTGHNVPRRFGWDCHGLPIEYEIDQILEVTKKSDVTDKIGIAKYNEECRNIVLKYRSEWKSVVERSGRWIDFDNDYKTMDINYMESVWWVFDNLFKKGLVYRDFKVMPYSTACTTPLSNFEAGQNYKDVSDPSIVVAFQLEDSQDHFLLAWTTTPWTLPSNMALCVNPEYLYVKFRTAKSPNFYYCAKSRLIHVLKAISKTETTDDLTKILPNMTRPQTVGTVEISEIVRGRDLKGLKYVPLFDFFSKDEYWNSRSAVWTVLSDSYVTDDTGTGIVHQAPAFGEDDQRVCLAHGVVEKGGRIPCPVDDSGCLTDPIDDPELLGLYVKDADKIIKSRLKNSGQLLISESIVHSYPHCWRSDKPLIYRAVPSWFVRVEAIKERLLANNAETNWVPKTVRDGRFHNWLQDARDWCISRNRFWGTPLPLWCSEDYTQIVSIGSIEELQKYTSKPLTDIHRHFIDDITIPDPRGPEFPYLKRVDEVFDCWFESGSMPYAQVHYPFEDGEKFKFPADFVGEGLDQTRGWFYTLSVLSCAIFDKPPFKNVIVNGLVLAKDGKKMSKRLKNYPMPQEIFDQYGADSLRLFLISSPAVRAEPIKFTTDALKDITKSAILPLYHSFRFFIQEASRYEIHNNKKWVPILTEKSETLMDKWIISLTQSLTQFFHLEMKNYRLYTALPRLLNFLDQFTNWYVRLNRDRLRGSSPTALVSLSCLYSVLLQLTLLLAPFTPFISEYIYKRLRDALTETHELYSESVHFLMLPTTKCDMISPGIEKSVALLQEVVQLGRSLRDKRKSTIKTPIRQITIISSDSGLIECLRPLGQYLKDELNSLEVTFSVESDRIKLTCLPNLRVLGSKYKNQLPNLIPKIKALNHKQLAHFQETLMSIEIDGIELAEEDLIINRTPMGIDDATEHIAVECNK